MKYKLLPRILIFFVSVVFLGVVMEIAGINYIVDDTKESIEDIYAETQIGIIDNVFKREKESIALLIQDYAVWDDMYSGLETEDYAWAFDNATGFLVEDEAYNIDMIYVNSTVSDFFEYYGPSELKFAIEESEFYDDLMTNNSMIIDIISVNDEIYLLAGNPITTSNLKKMNGYYIMGRKLTDTYVNDRLRSYLPVDEYLGVNTIVDYETDGNRDGEEIIIPYQLVDRQGELTKTYAFHFDMDRYHNSYDRLFKQTMAVTIVIGTIILAGFLFVFNRVNEIVRATVEKVDRVAKGDYEYQIDLSNNYELNEVITHVNSMGTQINEKIKHIQENHFETLGVLINAIEEKDQYTRGHSERVKDISVLLAKELKGVHLELLEEAALLHDIGKIGIPERILNKPGRLTKEEFDIIKMHPEKGERILLSSSRLQNVAKIVRQHHERVDGKGYPDGLCADKIEIEARIIAVADAFDAMTSKRSYREEMSFEKGLGILRENSGTQFDPKVVEVFVANQELIRILED